MRGGERSWTRGWRRKEIKENESDENNMRRREKGSKRRWEEAQWWRWRGEGGGDEVTVWGWRRREGREEQRGGGERSSPISSSPIYFYYRDVSNTSFILDFSNKTDKSLHTVTVWSIQLIFWIYFHNKMLIYSKIKLKDKLEWKEKVFFDLMSVSSCQE